MQLGLMKMLGLKLRQQKLEKILYILIVEFIQMCIREASFHAEGRMSRLQLHKNGILQFEVSMIDVNSINIITYKYIMITRISTIGSLYAIHPMYYAALKKQLQSTKISKIKNRYTKFSGINRSGKNDSKFKSNFNRFNPEVDLVLKNYFSLRFQLSNQELFQIIHQLFMIKNRRNLEKDHRWTHLTLTIQKKINEFNILHQLSMIKYLDKMGIVQDLYFAIIGNLINQEQKLSFNQKAKLLYYLTKSKKIDILIIVNLCNKLLKSLQQPAIKAICQPNPSPSKQQNLGAPITQSIFNKSQQISTKQLLLVLWSLHSLSVKDPILEDKLWKIIYMIVQNEQIETKNITLLLSVLDQYKKRNKQVFGKVVAIARKREQQLEDLDIESLVIFYSVLAHKGKIGEENKDLIKWLMETIILKHRLENKKLKHINLYHILSKARNIGIFDTYLYSHYITEICKNLKQINFNKCIFLMNAILKIRNENINKQKQKQKQKDKQVNEEGKANQKVQLLFEQKIITQKINNNITEFLIKSNQNSIERSILRQMVIRKDLIVPRLIRAKLATEQKEVRKQKKLQQKKQSENQQMDQYEQNIDQSQKIQTKNQSQIQNRKHAQYYHNNAKRYGSKVKQTHKHHNFRHNNSIK